MVFDDGVVDEGERVAMEVPRWAKQRCVALNTRHLSGMSRAGAALTLFTLVLEALENGEVVMCRTPCVLSSMDGRKSGGSSLMRTRCDPNQNTPVSMSDPSTNSLKSVCISIVCACHCGGCKKGMVRVVRHGSGGKKGIYVCT